MICEQCKEPINLHTTVYKGFDCEFCSKYCRLKFISFLKSKHCNLSNYKEWSPDKQKNKKLYTWDIDISINKNKTTTLVNETTTLVNENVSINNLEIKEECCEYIKSIKSKNDKNNNKKLKRYENDKIYQNEKTYNTVGLFNSIYDLSYSNIIEYVINAYEYTSSYFK